MTLVMMKMTGWTHRTVIIDSSMMKTMTHFEVKSTMTPPRDAVHEIRCAVYQVHHKEIECENLKVDLAAQLLLQHLMRFGSKLRGEKEIEGKRERERRGEKETR